MRAFAQLSSLGLRWERQKGRGAAFTVTSNRALHFHSYDANVVIERFAFGKLPNVVDDAMEEFLSRQSRVTGDGAVQLFFAEKSPSCVLDFE
jgi:hypothetical protein